MTKYFESLVFSEMSRSFMMYNEKKVWSSSGLGI